jgi:hypothetical protein
MYVMGLVSKKADLVLKGDFEVFLRRSSVSS